MEILCFSGHPRPHSIYYYENVKNAHIFQIVNSLAELDIPGCVFILLIIISIFSREGTCMEKQVKFAPIWHILRPFESKILGFNWSSPQLLQTTSLPLHKINNKQLLATECQTAPSSQDCPRFCRISQVTRNYLITCASFDIIWIYLLHMLN